MGDIIGRSKRCRSQDARLLLVLSLPLAYQMLTNNLNIMRHASRFAIEGAEWAPNIRKQRVSLTRAPPLSSSPCNHHHLHPNRYSGAGATKPVFRRGQRWSGTTTTSTQTGIPGRVNQAGIPARSEVAWNHNHLDPNRYSGAGEPSRYSGVVRGGFASFVKYYTIDK